MAFPPLRHQALTAAFTTATFLASSLAHAAPAPVSPEDAQAWRTPVQERTAPQIEAGDALGAATELDAAAKQHGDPVLFLDAAEAYFAAAEQQQDTAPIDLGLERVAVALDILHFLRDPMADPQWQVVAGTEVGTLINRANQDLRDAQALRERIEAGPEEDDEGEEEKKRRKLGPGKPLLIAGAATTGLGVAGLGVGVAGLALGAKHQSDAEDPTTYGATYDAVEKKGKRANTIAIAGLVAGGVLAAVGVTLIVLAKKRDKKSGATEEESASVRISPSFGGISLSGRF